MPLINLNSDSMSSNMLNIEIPLSDHVYPSYMKKNNLVVISCRDFFGINLSSRNLDVGDVLDRQTVTDSNAA